MRVDHAIRVLVELAVQTGTGLVTTESLACATDMPKSSLAAILRDLRRGGLVDGRQGLEGGFRFRIPPERITLADVVRAIDGPLMTIGEDRPGDIVYRGSAKPLAEVWVAARASLRVVLEGVTIADVASGTLPEALSTFLDEPDSWRDRPPKRL